MEEVAFGKGGHKGHWARRLEKVSRRIRRVGTPGWVHVIGRLVGDTDGGLVRQGGGGFESLILVCV